MKAQVVDDRINMATTIELSTTHMLDLFHQACNSITKVLKIKQVDVGVHDSRAILQVLEEISQQNLSGVIVAARIQANEQQIQFLFANACGMASTVGVGLDFATISWTRRNEVFVEAIEKDEWLQLWTEAFTHGSSFHEPIIMHLPHDSNIMTTKVDHIQTSEDICRDDVLGTLSTCGEVLLLKLIVNFFMTREVFGKIAKSQNHDSSMTTKDSDSTLPSVANDVEHEGSEYCNVVKKAKMMGQTQLPKDLLGHLWNWVLRNGDTNVINGSGEGHHEGEQGASRQNGSGEGHHEGEQGASRQNGSGEGHHEGDQGASRQNGSGEGHHEGEEGASRQNGSGEGHHGGDQGASRQNGSGEGHHEGDDGASRQKGSGEGYHEGDQGASRQNGNGGHDENNHGEGNDNNDDGDGEANDGESLSPIMSLGDCAIVDVFPGHGGRWFPSDIHANEDLNGAYIEPELRFQFLKTKDGNKDLVTTISTRFDLNKAIPKRKEKYWFGWFQTLLNVTLECSDANAAKLKHNEKVLETLEEPQKHIQRVNSQLDSGLSQFTFQVQAGIPVAKVKLGGLKSTKKKSSVTESVVEITNQQILGGFVPTKRTRIGSKPCLSYDFDFPLSPTDLNVIDQQRRNWYLRCGLCSTVCPIIEGTWHQLNNNVVSLYTFQATRNVCKLTYEPTSTRKKLLSRMTKSKKLKTKVTEVEQKYEVKLYVNHKMTHLCKLQTLGENESCDLMRVGVIQRDPTY